ncbi:hypothetical protein TrLO_g11508, partial [Triparma laevis f. longispina]
EVYFKGVIVKDKGAQTWAVDYDDRDKEFRISAKHISKTGKVLSEAERIRVAAEFLEKRREFEEEEK